MRSIMKKLFKVLQISAMIALCLGGWYVLYILFVIALDVAKYTCIGGAGIGAIAVIFAVILPVIIITEIRSILKRTIN